jgi:cold shock CspA family protein
MKRKGIVKWWHRIKGHGFILGDGEQDIWLHHSNCVKNGRIDFAPGDVVEFELGHRRGYGPCAYNVRKVASEQRTFEPKTGDTEPAELWEFTS